jgi:hypothetical protein
MFTRFASAFPLAALLAAAALSTPAQAGVSWSIGINAPIAPGVQVGTVIGGGPAHHHHRHHHRHYRPAPVVYAPPVYVAPPVYAPAPVVYAPRPVYYAPRPVVYRPPVIVRPAYVHHHHHHGKPPHPYQPQGGKPGRGGGSYGPMARADVR